MARFTFSTTDYDFTMVDFAIDETIPAKTHYTDFRTKLQYVLGVRSRRAACRFRMRSETEYNNFLSFFRLRVNNKETFTFRPATSEDAWSSVSFDPVYTFRRQLVPGVIGDFDVDLEEAPVNLTTSS